MRAGRRLDPQALVLLLTPVLWGATFPGTKLALRRLSVLPFMAWSRLLGFVTILLLLPLLRVGGSGGRGPFRPARSARRVLWAGAVLGSLMFVGYLLQTEGLARTTATNAGFITGLYVVFTPVMAALAFGQRAPRSAWVAVCLSFAGLAMLSIAGIGDVRVHAGDLLVLAGAVAWAGHIVAVGRFSPRFPPLVLSLGQMAAATAFHLVATARTGLQLHQATLAAVWPLLVLTGVLGSGVAFTIQIVAQRRLTPARAVILLAGESLFSALFAALWIGERLTPTQWGGAVLVLGAIAYSELTARRATSMVVEPASVP